MRKLFTFFIAVAASLTSLWADAIQFANLPYIQYGDSVRVQATTSLPDMPMPTNYEYGFEYEYKNADGNSGGGGVEPCAIANGHMEALLKIKPSDSFLCYRYRPYYVTDSWNGERAAGDWVLISEWSQTEWPDEPQIPITDIDVDSLVNALEIQTWSPLIITDTSITVVASTNLPDMPKGGDIRCGFEVRYESSTSNGGGPIWCAVENGRMVAQLKYNGPYTSYKYSAIVDIDYVPRIYGEWVEVPEWVNLQQGSCGENTKWKFSEADSVLTISGRGKMNDYNSLKEPWSELRTIIKKIVIMDGVTYIGKNAFSGCITFDTISIPSSVTIIGERAFSGCTNLRNVNIPNGVTKICDRAFSACDELMNISLPSTLDTIETCAFCYSKKVMTINIPNSVRYIGQSAFAGCSALNSIVFSDSITHIGNSALQYCSSLTSVTLPARLTELGDWLFDGCSSLQSIVIPVSVENIGECVFRNCSSLTSIHIPQNVINISTPLYSGSIVEGCSALSTITIDSNNPKYDSRNNCNAIIETETNKMIICCKNSTIPNSVIELANALFQNRQDLDSLIIPEGVQILGNNIFNGCSNLKKVQLPNTITQLGSWAFAYCSKLKEINLPQHLKAIERGCFEYCSSLTSLTLPEGVADIGMETFMYASKLDTINIPSSVVHIGKSAFTNTGIYRNAELWEDDLLYVDNCLIAAKPTIPNEVRINEGTRIIAGSAFYTYKMQSVVMPASLLSIGEQAFAGCDALTSITCNAPTPPSIISSLVNGKAYTNVDKSIPVYVPAGAEELYRAADEWGEFTNIRAIGQAQTTNVEDLQAEPTDNSVVIEWPSIENAVVYTVEIRKNGALICTLSFNANGQLTSVQFAAPARNKAYSPQRATETATGWTYTIAGLEANTAYTYTVIAKDSSNEEVYNNTVAFTTQPQSTPTDFERVNAFDTPHKTLRNGQILIQRDDKKYTLQGQEIE